MAIKQQGGVTIVQEPEEALYAGMPQSAMDHVEIDYVRRVSDIALLLAELAIQPVAETVQAMSEDMKIESDMAELELSAMQNLERPGSPSGFGCPECGGVLWELKDGKLIRFRCRTGHAYSTGSLLAEQSEAQEEALWNALRALEEKAALTQRLADQASDRDRPYSAKRFQEQAQTAQQRAKLVRQLLLKEESKELSTNGHLVKKQANVPEQTKEVNSSAFYIVALCASAGGLHALSKVLSDLKPDFPAVITVVQHLYPHQPTLLSDILSRRTDLPVKLAEQGDVLQPGKVYIAPPNNHLLVTPAGTLCLSQAELVHFVRPSADLLLDSLAASFKDRAIAVVLTGTGNDGAMGAKAIKKMGGTVIAQDQNSSEFFGMPGAAINTGIVNWVVPLDEIASTLVRLVTNKEEL